MNTKTAAKLARDLEDVTEKNHFGSDAFYAHKRIFATVWHEKNEVNLRLSPELQDEYLGLDGDGFSQVPNAFGKQGWTTAHMDYVDKADFAKALRAAYEYAAVKRPSTKKPTTKKPGAPRAKAVRRSPAVVRGRAKGRT